VEQFLQGVARAIGTEHTSKLTFVCNRKLILSVKGGRAKENIRAEEEEEEVTGRWEKVCSWLRHL
jgi:hypothetical protein